MATSPRFPQPSFTLPTTGTIEQRLRIIAEAISRKADVTLEPVYSAILLVAPGGAVYRVGVDDAGALSAVVVSRT